MIPGTLTGSINEAYYNGLNDACHYTKLSRTKPRTNIDPQIVSYITSKGAHAIIDLQNFGRHYGNAITDNKQFPGVLEDHCRPVQGATARSSSTPTMSTMTWTTVSLRSSTKPPSTASGRLVPQANASLSRKTPTAALGLGYVFPLTAGCHCPQQLLQSSDDVVLT